MKRLSLVTAATILAVAPIAGCGQVTPSEAAAPQPSKSASCGQGDTQSRSDAIRAEKRANPLAPDGRPAANAGDFAYASRPQDLAGPGRYVFEFGPVGGDFNFPVAPSALTYDFPAGFTGNAKAATTAKPQVVRLIDDNRYLRVSFDIDGTFPPCRSFVAIAY